MFRAWLVIQPPANRLFTPAANAAFAMLQLRAASGHEAAMIHHYDNATQTRWDKGEFKVQLNTASSSRPMGFCDGTAADLAELQQLAEAENSSLRIEKKVLKTGREIWTLHGA